MMVNRCLITGIDFDNIKFDERSSKERKNDKKFERLTGIILFLVLVIVVLTIKLIEMS